MDISGLVFYFIMALDSFLKGSNGILEIDWVKVDDGFCPSTPPEGLNMTLLKCMVLCSHNNACKSLYYTSDQSQCRLLDSYDPQPSDLPLQISQSTAHYKSVNGFNTVLLDDNDVLIYKIFFDMRVTHKGAINLCINHGGHLLHMFTEARFMFFSQMAQQLNGKGPYWIDVTNEHATNHGDINGWTTVAGQPIPKTFWQTDEPDRPWLKHCAVAAAGPNLMKWLSHVCTPDTNIAICEI